MTAAISPGGEGVPKPSRYAKTVEAAIEGRWRVCARPIDWIVIRNRLALTVSDNERQIASVLDYMAPRIGFRTIHGLSDRTVYREFFPFGLTAFDQLDEFVLGVKPSMAHVLARMEVGMLIEEIGLLPSQLSGDEIIPSIIGSLIDRPLGEAARH